MGPAEASDAIRLENPFLRVEARAREQGALLRLSLRDAASGSDREEIAVDGFLGYPEDRLSGYPRLSEASPDGASGTILWESVRVEQRISLLLDAPVVSLSFTFHNGGPILVRPAFGLCFRLRGDGLRWRVPAETGPRSDAFPARPERRYLRPSSPWCGWESRGRQATLLFPAGVADAVEVRRDSSGGVSLSPLIYFLGLSPGCEAEFRCLLHWGADEVSPAELLERFAPELRADYRECGTDGRRRTEAARERLVSAAPEAAPCHLLTEYGERMTRLAEGEDRRMEWIQRLGRGEASIEDVFRGLG